MPIAVGRCPKKCQERQKKKENFPCEYTHDLGMDDTLLAIVIICCAVALALGIAIVAHLKFPSTPATQKPATQAQAQAQAKPRSRDWDVENQSPSSGSSKSQSASPRFDSRSKTRSNSLPDPRSSPPPLLSAQARPTHQLSASGPDRSPTQDRSDTINMASQMTVTMTMTMTLMKTQNPHPFPHCYHHQLHEPAGTVPTR